MKTIYLAMALTDTPDWWRINFYRCLCAELESLDGVQVLKFIGLDPNADPTEVHDFDINLAESADLMVALTRIPSFGVGQEIEARGRLGKPTLLMNPRGKYLSNMPRGVKGALLVEYETSKQDGARQVRLISVAVARYLEKQKAAP